MRKLILFLAALVCMTMAQAKSNAIPSGILKNSKAKYVKASNTLILEDGFQYRLSKGLAVFNTGKDLHILLKGNAEFRAALVFKDNIIIDAEKPATLSVTSNISGSAVQCPSLTINKNATVSLLSRNSQEGMFALSCDAVTVNEATLIAEVTTTNLAVQTKEMNLNGSWIEKPKGGFLDKEKARICFGDGLPAKLVRITPVPKK